jgi:hypothetical protein
MSKFLTFPIVLSACFVVASAAGCSATGADTAWSGDATPGDAANDAGDGGSGFDPDIALDAPAPPPTVTIYAHTDSTLYELDPSTKTVTTVGDFAGLDTANKENVTDLAVTSDGKIFAISSATNAAGHVFDVTLPASGTGAVQLTPRLTLPSTKQFYALGLAPAGVLDAGEALVAGDRNGDLYYVPMTGSTAPTALGSFGTVVKGDPGSVSSTGTSFVGDRWQLSGDVVFLSNGGTPIGLATIRPATATGCDSENDVLVQIDLAQLATKSATAKLRQRFIGKSGTGFGRLYGVAVWNDAVWAFQRYSSSTSQCPSPAKLVSISLTSGVGTLVTSFPDIANGWSGAGVTTAAKVTVPF